MIVASALESTDPRVVLAPAPVHSPDGRPHGSGACPVIRQPRSAVTEPQRPVTAAGEAPALRHERTFPTGRARPGWDARPVELTSEQVHPHVPRFLAVLQKTDTCWYLAGRARSNGYGLIQLDGLKTSGHRFAYAAFVGDIPDGYEIDHLCRDRSCVNPDHLELVTRSENLRRRDSFGKALGHLPVRERLLARREVTEAGCWLWSGAKVRGYGVASLDGETRYVHRVMYELDVAALGDGDTIDHLCRVPSCFNPEHLEAVSRAENSHRVPQAGKRRRTCRNGHFRDEVGTNPDGTCTGCRPERARKGPPRPLRDDVDVRCANGHAYTEVGRYPSGGCVACQRVKDQARLKGPKAPVQYCPRGHDTFEVGRSPSNGECRECARQYARERYGYVRTAADLRRECRNGHKRTAQNTRQVKRVREGLERVERVCLDCRREALARYSAKREAGSAG